MAFDKKTREKAILRISQLRRIGLTLRQACNRTASEIGTTPRTVRRWWYQDQSPWLNSKMSRGIKKEQKFVPRDKSEKQKFVPLEQKFVPVTRTTPQKPRNTTIEDYAAWAKWTIDLADLAYRASDIPCSPPKNYTTADEITSKLNMIDFYTDREGLSEFLKEQDRKRRQLEETEQAHQKKATPQADEEWEESDAEWQAAQDQAEHQEDPAKEHQAEEDPAEDHQAGQLEERTRRRAKEKDISLAEALKEINREYLESDEEDPY